MSSLKETIEALELPVPEDGICNKLSAYCDALWKANETVNLTRHTTYEKFVSRDLVDTIQVSRLIPAGRAVLDMGSGGGVPGMVLAILRPDLEVTLSESVGKKAVALEAIAKEISLDAEICNSRAEKLLEDFSYDFTTVRAVGPLYKICTWLDGVWSSAGKVLAIKGPNWKNEKNEAAEKGLLKKIDIEVVAEYSSPGADWNSLILQLSAKGYRKR
ncbi:16S rRNA (guanine(527)-N(7))-methyltransferase RsmG [Mariniblastus fucicola]|uniref:Ribosomal RNA small subunit methyltransferase G n=1 Tax=Mariniblastus fucicola TaxID=980251 RepID=A0A5B9P776_9BACT|nr:16S rRNA (guanine(527)-N(7))-methyltransferase RsmG [Mariniblastus fucicola]QEG20800.1 Ribosomal RNA small subunit methyltransferase G [Mariniblastus fucicola]